jgi:hypothetical protein
MPNEDRAALRHEWARRLIDCPTTADEDIIASVRDHLVLGTGFSQLTEAQRTSISNVIRNLVLEYRANDLE